MRILIITPFIPYPLSEGGKISQFATIDYLRKIHKVKLILVSRVLTDDENINELKRLWPDVEIFNINIHILPTQTKAGNLRRIYRFIKRLLIKPLKQSEPLRGIEDPYTFNLCEGKDRNFIKKISDIFNNNTIDIVQTEFIEFLDLALAFPKNVKKIFVHHEIYFAKLESEIDRQHYIQSQYDSYAINYVKNREINFLKLYNAVFTFSETDKIKLSNELINTKVYNTPFPVLDKYFVPPASDGSFEIKKIVFLGPEIHYPNKDAMEWYLGEIAPLINSSSNLKLHIIGQWSTETIKKYKSCEYVVFAGFIDDLIDYCKNSIMVVPVRIGSGIRSKILYAMAQSIPVISTSLGCEGLNVTDNKDILIANSPENFANMLLKLINDTNFALMIAANGHSLVKNNYSQQALVKLRSKYYEEVLSSR